MSTSIPAQTTSLCENEGHSTHLSVIMNSCVLLSKLSLPEQFLIYAEMNQTSVCVARRCNASSYLYLLSSGALPVELSAVKVNLCVQPNINILPIPRTYRWVSMLSRFQSRCCSTAALSGTPWASHNKARPERPRSQHTWHRVHSSFNNPPSTRGVQSRRPASTTASHATAAAAA